MGSHCEVDSDWVRRDVSNAVPSWTSKLLPSPQFRYLIWLLREVTEDSVDSMIA